MKGKFQLDTSSVFVVGWNNNNNIFLELWQKNLGPPLIISINHMESKNGN